MRQTFTHMLNHQREYTTKLPLSAYRGLWYQLKTFALVPFINKAPMVLSCTWVLGDSAHSLGVRGRQGCHMRTKRYDATMACEIGLCMFVPYNETGRISTKPFNSLLGGICNFHHVQQGDKIRQTACTVLRTMAKFPKKNHHLNSKLTPALQPQKGYKGNNGQNVSAIAKGKLEGCTRWSWKNRLLLFLGCGTCDSWNCAFKYRVTPKKTYMKHTEI